MATVEWWVRQNGRFIRAYSGVLLVGLQVTTALRYRTEFEGTFKKDLLELMLLTTVEPLLTHTSDNA